MTFDQAIAIPPRFLPAYQQIQRLSQHERYLGAFIFGSLASPRASEPKMSMLKC